MTERACTHYTHTHTHIYYPLSTFLGVRFSVVDKGTRLYSISLERSDLLELELYVA